MFQMPEISYTDGAQSGWGRFLLVGPSGGGKTHFAGTMPQPFFIDSDKGLRTVRNLHAPFIQLSPGQRSSDITMEVLKAIKKGEATFKDTRTIVFDSITSLSDMMEMELVRYPRESSSEVNKEVMSLPDFRVHRRRIINLIRFAQDIPCNVIFTANTAVDKDEITGSLLEYPMVAGKEMKRELTAMFDEVYYFEYDTKNKVYVMWTRPHRWFQQAKTRFGLPERIEDPTWQKIEKYFKVEEKGV